MARCPRRPTRSDRAWPASRGFRTRGRDRDLLGTLRGRHGRDVLRMPEAIVPPAGLAHGGRPSWGCSSSAPAVGSLVVSATAGWVHRVRRQGERSSWGRPVGDRDRSPSGSAEPLARVRGAVSRRAGHGQRLMRSTIWNQSSRTRCAAASPAIELVSYTWARHWATSSGLVERRRAPSGHVSGASPASARPAAVARRAPRACAPGLRGAVTAAGLLEEHEMPRVGDAPDRLPEQPAPRPLHLLGQARAAGSRRCRHEHRTIGLASSGRWPPSSPRGSPPRRPMSPPVDQDPGRVDERPR